MLVSIYIYYFCPSTILVDVNIYYSCPSNILFDKSIYYSCPSAIILNTNIYNLHSLALLKMLVYKLLSITKVYNIEANNNQDLPEWSSEKP